MHAEVIEALAAGKIRGIEGLITSRVAIEDVVEKGFRVLLKDKDAQGEYFGVQVFTGGH